jgi:hypothetical protein
LRSVDVYLEDVHRVQLGQAEVNLPDAFFNLVRIWFVQSGANSSMLGIGDSPWHSNSALKRLAEDQYHPWNYSLLSIFLQNPGYFDSFKIFLNF